MGLEQDCASSACWTMSVRRVSQYPALFSLRDNSGCVSPQPPHFRIPSARTSTGWCPVRFSVQPGASEVHVRHTCTLYKGNEHGGQTAALVQNTVWIHCHGKESSVFCPVHGFPVILGQHYCAVGSEAEADTVSLQLESRRHD